VLGIGPRSYEAELWTFLWGNLIEIISKATGPSARDAVNEH